MPNNNGNLYLQISANLDTYTKALKAGKVSLTEFAGDVDQQIAGVEAAFNKLGGSSVQTAARSMEAAFKQSFGAVRAAAEQALTLPKTDAGALSINLIGAQQAVTDAQAIATAYREIADAAASVVLGNDAATASEKALAVAAEARAQGAEATLTSVEQEVAALERLQVALNQSASALGPTAGDLALLARSEADAAAAALEAAVAQEQLATRTDRLLAAIDPVYAAQQRYNATLEEATALLDAGSISSDRYHQVEIAAAAALREVADAASVAATKQQELLAVQAAAARADVGADRAQAAISYAQQITLANKSAADSFAFFQKVGADDAQAIEVFEQTAVQSVIEGSERIALANKSAADSFAVFRAAGLEDAQGSGAIVEGHNRIGASGLIAEHVVRSFADSITAGQSPVRAFALELPRVAEAMQFFAIETGATEGALGKFATFMSGGFGLALTLAVSLLSPLVAELIESTSAANQAADAEKAYAKQLDEVGDAVDKANGKLVERNRLFAAIALQEKRPQIEQAKSDARDATTQAFDAARTAAVGGKAGVIADTLTDAGGLGPVPRNSAIDAAIASSGGDVVKLRNSLDALARTATGPDKAALEKLADTVNHSAGLFIAANKRADDLRGAAGATSTALSGGSILTADSIRRAAADKAAITPLDKARAHAQDLDAQIRDVGAQTVSPQQQAELAKLAQQYDAATAAVKRLEAAQHEANSNRQVGRQVDISQAEDIVHGIGGTVTSSYRSTAKQAQLYAAYQAGTGPLAARPGTSLHESGQALDVAKTAGISLASLKKAFADAGVHLTEALDEGNHYHVGFGPKGPSADTVARRQQAAVRKGANDDGAYQGELRTADAGIGKANADLANTAEARYNVAVDQLRTELGERDKAVQDQVTAGKITQAEADILKVKLGSAEYEEEMLAARKRDSELLDQKLARDQLEIDGQIELINLQSSLATTTKQRRDQALRLLALDEQREKAGLDKVIADPTSTPAAVANAQTRKGQIDADHPLKVQQADQQNASPLQAYSKQLHSATDDMGEALQGVAVNGLKNIEDGFVGVINGTETVSQAFSKMATSIIESLAKIAIEKAIVSALGGSFFGLSLGGSVDGKASGGLVGFALGGLPGNAGGGGQIIGPGTGRSDSILAMLGGTKPIRVSNGEFIVNAASTKKYRPVIEAINDNTLGHALGGFADGGFLGAGSFSIPSPADLSANEIRSVSRSSSPSVAPISFDLRGAVMTQDLLNQMNTISSRHAQAAIIGGARQAAEDRHDDAYSQIPQ